MIFFVSLTRKAYNLVFLDLLFFLRVELLFRFQVY